MQTIWKYELSPECELKIPRGSIPLHVHTQNDVPMLWMLVNSDAPLEKRRFKSYGTGHKMYDETLQYIGTFHLNNGLVFHTFEVK
jgi:hypothetical protein